jgi:hypothetical protein
MSQYDQIDVFYHVTSKQNRNSIFKDGKFKLYLATDSIYDSYLFTYRGKGAPKVVYFTANLFRGDLPTKTPYPRNGTSNSTSYRICVDCDYIADRIDQYTVYYISSVKKVTNSYIHMLFYFVNNNDETTKKWCDKYLHDDEYDIFDDGSGYETESTPIFFDEDTQSFNCLKMDNHYAINVAFSEDFRGAFSDGLVTYDTVSYH